MCGIAGFVNRDSLNGDAAEQILPMLKTLTHRGPDDQGVWHDLEHGVVLGHRRLAILDLSSNGHQPMSSPSHRYQLVFNGEIYNFQDLRTQLQSEGFSLWRGTSDTEVVITAIERWGITKTLSRCVGMFSLAVWDSKELRLTLARDRMGEKPLYYGMIDGCFVFASELKAIRAHWKLGAKLHIDRHALGLFFRHNYIPAPHTIYAGISKLLPGTLLKYDLRTREIRRATYWSFEDVVRAGMISPFDGSDEDAVDHLQSLVSQSIRGQLVADVPVGCFLSGGIDSSLIVAIAQSLSSQPLRTFSIGFHEHGFDEAQFAKQIARHIGTDHTETYATPQEAANIIPRLPMLFDEPFADISQLPMHLVSQLAAKSVKVSLSGDGGDELFGGYECYALATRIWSRVLRLPRPVRCKLARVIDAVPNDILNMTRHVSFVRRRLGRNGIPAHKLKRFAALLDEPSLQRLYRKLVSIWDNPEGLVLGASEPDTVFTRPSIFAEGDASTEQLMFIDSLSYLPDDILVKVDRASMGVSLESRIPLLDHRIVEFAWTLPGRMRIYRGTRKWILRRLLHRYVPAELFARPKQGFSVPIGEWLRGPLRDWAESLLSTRQLQSAGYLDPVAIRAVWDEHQRGERNWERRLWTVLSFQSWLEVCAHD